MAETSLAGSRQILLLGDVRHQILIGVWFCDPPHVESGERARLVDRVQADVSRLHRARDAGKSAHDTSTRLTKFRACASRVESPFVVPLAHWEKRAFRYPRKWRSAAARTISSVI